MGFGGGGDHAKISKNGYRVGETLKKIREKRSHEKSLSSTLKRHVLVLKKLLEQT